MRLIFCLLFLTLLTSCEQKTVRFSAIVFRHGDRTPVKPYPTDPWRNASVWPVAFGQLTNTGKNQHYNFGKGIRERYSDMVSVNYDPDQIYVRSTDVDRTLMSAQANLAGLYPPKGTAIWHETLMWQPIPVHTVPEGNDQLLAMKKQCPAYDIELDHVKGSTEYKQRLKKYRDLMNLLTAFTGMKISDYRDIDDIYNTLFIENLYHLALPPWTVTVFPEIMKGPACYSFRVPTLTPKLARLKVGPLFTQIIEHMLRATHKSKLKLAIYSAHDITVGSILNSMGMYDGQCPVYTSAVFFELIQNEDDPKYYVRISYRNTTDNTEPTIMNIPGCGKECEIELFMKLNSNLLIHDWESECNVNKMLADPILSTVTAIAVFALIFILIKIIASCIFMNSDGRVELEYPDDGTGSVRYIKILE